MSDVRGIVQQSTEHLFDPDFVERAALAAEFQGCSLTFVAPGEEFTVAGLFAGIGGIELGLGRSGGRAEFLCEYWEPARQVLSRRFEGAELASDVRDVRSLPNVDLVTAGFPCTDLSQAGRMKGIAGEQSALVGEVFRLLRKSKTPVLLLENVRNMLVLDGGEAMRFLVDQLEALGYRWAYRLVDSRFTGVPQRRQRVIFVASRTVDPRAVLFADDAGEPDESYFRDDAHGFYWTEGLRGLGWARDAVPTLKGGSTIGIPSPPAIWNPSAERGMRLVTPRIEDAERLQGFSRRWTAPARSACDRDGTRWKLVGNAVTVGVSTWVGRRLVSPGEPITDGRPLRDGDRWPAAAFGARGQAWSVDVSKWPRHGRYRHLADAVDLERGRPLSLRAAAGFLARAERSGLRFDEGFLEDVADHVGHIRALSAA